MNGIFDNSDLYPTPENVIFRMLGQIEVNGKTILEPSAGKGDLVDALTAEGANILYCETSPPLQRILSGKGRFLCADFLDVTSDQVSHIDGIVMNPPFSEGVKHILHAYRIAPAGCMIVSLCNASNLENDYSKERKELKGIIETTAGVIDNLGKCFETAERQTFVEVAMVTIRKPGTKENDEFEGFFMDEEPETEGSAGLMEYNAIRDIVNRYVQAVNIYSEVLTVKSRLNAATGSFFGGDIGVSVSLSKEDYKKELQRAGWQYIFKALNLTRDMTSGVRETINKFIEQQKQIPFTMRNIYRMLEIIVTTRGQTMDKAIEEAFDRITEKHHDNRHHVKGWKTNLHYLVGKKFILPYMINPSKEYGYTSATYSHLRNSYDGVVPDLEKALCFITGIRYEDIITVSRSISRNPYGEWYESHFFKYKGYKNGNMHFEFKDVKVWEMFNARIAKIKGYPLFEQKEQTAYQRRNAGQKAEPKQQQAKKPKQAKVLFEI